MGNETVLTIFYEALLLCLIITLVFALFVGLLFLIWPQQGKAFSRQCNRWFSLRQTTKSLESPIAISRPLYRHHRLVGVTILLSTSYILYRFGFDYQQDAVVAQLASTPESALLARWLLDAMLWFLIPVSLLLIAFGTAMALFPSILKGLERRSNAWLSTRKILQPADKQYYLIDGVFESHPRLFGLITFIVAGFNLFLILMFYLRNVH